MQDVALTSPVAFAQKVRKPVMGQVNGMQAALSFDAADVEAKCSQTLSICDVSCLDRFGLKGPKAAQWLQTSGMKLPVTANSWVLQDNGSLLMRLGNTEFLLEDSLENDLARMFSNKALDEGGLHKVIRNDAAFIVSGERTAALFSEVCAIDLDNGMLEENRLVMTVIAGVSATVIKQTLNGQSVYRIWCDGTFGSYLWKTLLGIIEEHGGGPVGFNFYYTLN
ncbi:MAG: sarcosine oxidase subunit gamma [Methylophaga sp.]